MSNDVEIIQINISGEDKPGVTSSLTDILAQYDAFILGINQETFDSFSEELQQIIVETAEEACEYQRELIRTNEEEQLADIEAGGTLVTYYEDMDIDSFREAAEVIYEEYEPIVTSELLALFRD